MATRTERATLCNADGAECKCTLHAIVPFCRAADGKLLLGGKYRGEMHITNYPRKQCTTYDPCIHNPFNGLPYTDQVINHTFILGWKEVEHSVHTIWIDCTDCADRKEITGLRWFLEDIRSKHPFWATVIDRCPGVGMCDKRIGVHEALV